MPLLCKGPRSGPFAQQRTTTALACFYSATLAWNATAVDMLSWVALIEDPGCIEAHLFRGGCAKDPDLRMQHLQAAVMAGHALWDPVAKAEGEDMTWWGFAATRPYMRAIKALGLEHHARGDLRAARDCFEALLEMNPNDN